jgi:hypothetical protein
MSKKEKHYSPQFKAKASLAALQIEETSTKRPVAPISTARWSLPVSGYCATVLLNS